MNVFAYGLASARGSIRKMIGSDHIETSPPVASHSFEVRWTDHLDVLFIKLHGEEGSPRWFDDFYNPALNVNHVRQMRLKGTVVFVSNCWLPESPFLEALLAAGAKAVIGGSGVNYGGIDDMGGADLLGAYWLKAYEKGASPKAALRIAKVVLLMMSPIFKTSDARQFQIWEQ